jgi:hypothetical protein
VARDDLHAFEGVTAIEEASDRAVVELEDLALTVGRARRVGESDPVKADAFLDDIVLLAAHAVREDEDFVALGGLRAGKAVDEPPEAVDLRRRVLGREVEDLHAGTLPATRS